MTLTPEETRLVDAARAFADGPLSEAADRIAASGEPEMEIFPAAAELGLTRIQIPVSDGGLGFSFACKSQVGEALARAGYGLSMAILNTHNAALRLLELGPEPMKAKLLPGLLSGEITGCTAMSEPGAGSDFAAISTKAVQDGDGWRLDGAKTWVTNLRHASFAIVYAQSREIGDGGGVVGFACDLTRPGVTRRDERMFAEAGSGVGGIDLAGYRAEADEMILPPGSFAQIMSGVNGARIYLGAMCCGMVEGALEEAWAHGRRRETFGAPLTEHQGWRWVLARAETELAAARGLVRSAEAALDRGEDVQLAAAQAKIFATDMAVRQIPVLVHAMGAAGLNEGGRAARHLAGMQMTTLADGSTEMLLERVAKLAPKARGR